ncbi:hypothetical protein ACFVFS_39215 [Kitasatospora sp. NPDC057692]|uniref:hypothetical protein n=1 Tax=Kitasatospora sp. NPDC057692 TaxID=3346215 RepID=UPI0036C38384
MFSRPSAGARGPYDAAFLPRLTLTLRAADEPITAPVAKLGGEPVWLEEPCWPVDPVTGHPLVFIGQFPVPGDELRLAYLFIGEDGRIMGGLGPQDGDALLLVQPGGRIPPFASIGDTDTRGRTLWRWGPDEEEIPVEFHVDFATVPDHLERQVACDVAWEALMRGDSPDDVDFFGADLVEYLGGTASFPHTTAQVEEPWLFFIRLQDSPDDGDRYFLNFGYGYGFGFLSPDRLEGRFYWESS